MVNTVIDVASEFAIAYGLQMIGALVILLIGLKVAWFLGRRVTRLCEIRKLDITLSNFGIDIAPLVALGGAAAFDISFAVQGPMANYGAGLVIILTRPFLVGNTVLV